MDKPDVNLLLRPLKAFQRRTVDYVFERLYREGVKRFLVADEVGLGKTLVARGVIALAIEELWPRLAELKRINIVYICSNGDIARQNINRLNVFDGGSGDSNHLAFATRLTMLPLHLGKLDENPVNFISFTPGTSFNLRSSGGIGDERAMLYQLLAGPWELNRDRHRRRIAKHIFRLGVERGNWAGYLDRASRVIEERGGIDKELMAAFLAELEGNGGVRQHFEELVEAVSARLPMHESRVRFLGDIRRCLARVCVWRLEPDLIILDEFQRFAHLLPADYEGSLPKAHGDSTTSPKDAEELFRILTGADGDRMDPRVLLLSATPYRPYTPRADTGEKSHHEELVRTVGYLLGSKEERDRFEEELRAYGEELFQAAAVGRGVRPDVVNALERRLRRVMVRTERLGAAGDRCGMLSPGLNATSPLATEDLAQFALVDGTSRALDSGEPIEYWKSAPYLLNLMDHRGYRLKERFVEEVRAHTSSTPLAQAVREGADALIDWSEIEQYAEVPPANARLRALVALGQPDGASGLLWVPPALPYYRATTGPYAKAGLQDISKVLVFSSWLIVPKVISVLMSYEAERQMMAGNVSSGRSYGYSEYSDRARLLEFRMSEGRREQMTHMTLLYPSITLAAMIDPMSMSRDGKVGELPPDHGTLAAVRDRVQKLIGPLLPADSNPDGPEDQRWCWVVLALLDQRDQAVRQWLDSTDDKLSWEKMVPARLEQGNFATYVGNLHAIVKGEDAEELGRPPDDLAEIVARIALGSPAVAALRALLRAAGNPQNVDDRVQLLAEAARVALGFRSLFNMPVVTAMVRREHPTDERGYWRSILAYCVGGNLQAVLDEYSHVLRESLGLLDREPSSVASELASEIAAAVSLRTVNLELDEITVDGRSGGIGLGERRRSVRCRYAMRFGDGRSEREGGLEPQETRKEQVRQAFNSPFWPFVLTTTSIGQEGLDFHQYCRHIMHWNLPGNPVDLEQREGRIHRYKGHAVRWNVATHVVATGLPDRLKLLDDVWAELFRLVQDAIGDDDELVPYWLIPSGRYQICRHVPLYPLSREHARYDDLKQKLALYRLAFGQPRQEDLLTYLQSRSSANPGNGFKPTFINLSPQ
ncbi:MAG: hypothetical protein HOJ57_17315 [Lentisphaerae bacterium]|nr:hypothetical protein [Lentisphaerota bacterium]MBT5607703.1 hypothetical protein [Lentisphaerota bacterium]